MGRPIEKRFFGNLSAQTQNNESGVGGEGILSVSQPGGGVGSFVVNNTYKNFPLLTATAPQIPGGVTAVLTPVFELETVTYASGGQTDADYVAGLSTAITGLGGGAVVRIVETANKVTSVDLVGGNRGEFRRGDFTGNGITSFQVLQAPNAGTDLQITATFRVKRIEVTDQGSGYTSTPSLSWNGHTFTGQTAPSLNVVTMTSNRQNALAVSAYITGGSSASLGDIVKQTGAKSFLVRTADGVGKCVLTTGTVTAGLMSITATKADTTTFLVRKITGRKVFDSSGNSYAWTLGSATGNIVSLASN